MNQENLFGGEALVLEVPPPMVEMRREAIVSPCGLFRYVLTREWGARGVVAKRTGLLWVLLNPSTGDHEVDDPTIRACVSFARSWAFDAFTIVNLFAFRSPNPKALRAAVDPVGPANDDTIRLVLGQAGRCERVVCAWGAHGGLFGRDRVVGALLREAGVAPLCLGVTKGGQPRHPLRLSGLTPLVSYEPDRGA